MDIKRFFNKMNKKGIILDETVVLIVGLILTIVVIFGVLYYTGFLENFAYSIQLVVCMASAYFRGVVISLLWAFFIVIILMAGLTSGAALVQLLTGGSFSPQTYGILHGSTSGLISGSTSGLISGLKSGLKTHTKDIIVLYFLDQMVIALVGMVFASIPLVCNIASTDVGSFYNPTAPVDFEDFILSSTTDTWNAFGQGIFNPLWGLDPPNPRILLKSNVFLGGGISMKNVYVNITEKAPDWKLAAEQGDTKTRIRLFCPDDMGFDYEDWDTCYINNKIVYVMYFDNHPWAVYGSGVCGGHIPGAISKSWFPGLSDRDYIVICVESATFPGISSVDLPDVKGDGYCHANENCGSSPYDCYCNAHQYCLNGVCEYCGFEGDSCNPSIGSFCCLGYICDAVNWGDYGTCRYEIGGSGGQLS